MQIIDKCLKRGNLLLSRYTKALQLLFVQTRVRLAHGSCEEDYDDSADLVYVPRDATTTETIHSSTVTVYEYPSACMEANGGECMQLESGRYILNSELNFGDHYVSMEACLHMNVTCTEQHGLAMTEEQRQTHWQCVFTTTAKLETAAELWCGSNRISQNRSIIQSSYGHCAKDISVWDVSAITNFRFYLMRNTEAEDSATIVTQMSALGICLPL